MTNSASAIRTAAPRTRLQPRDETVSDWFSPRSRLEFCLFTQAAMNDTPLSPNEEAEIDRQIRIEKMKEELNQITGGNMHSGAFGPITSRMEEAFLEHLLAVEKAKWDTHFDRLGRRGVAMIPPAELDDAAVTRKLWEVIRELSEMSCFLYDTDHLNDRELYDWLWNSGLREESPDHSDIADAAWHSSPIGAGTAEDTAIWLKYYADEERRHRWHLDFPDDEIPDHAELPFDRDRHLPRRAPY
jgi:hypothetical protein